MDKYIYLIWALLLGIIWLVIIAIRKDLVRKMIKPSLLGGIMGILAEFWYFKDYWRPPSILGQGVASIEDFLVGFFITGIAVSIYDMVFGFKNISGKKPHRLFFSLLFVLGISSLMILNIWVGINSILVSEAAFLLCTIIIILMRKDLLRPALMSGLLMVLVILPIYVLLFDVLSPNFWHLYWLVNQTKFDILVFGDIPLTELFWYFSWGCFCGIGHNFYSGTKKVPLINSSKKN